MLVYTVYAQRHTVYTRGFSSFLIPGMLWAFMRKSEAISNRVPDLLLQL